MIFSVAACCTNQGCSYIFTFCMTKKNNFVNKMLTFCAFSRPAWLLWCPKDELKEIKCPYCSFFLIHPGFYVLSADGDCRQPTEKAFFSYKFIWYNLLIYVWKGLFIPVIITHLHTCHKELPFLWEHCKRWGTKMLKYII